MRKIITTLRLLLSMLVLAALAAPANATFIKDPSPGGEKFFIFDAYKDVSSFIGNVGANNSGPIINVSVTGNVDTGSGYANIKPVKDGLLTELLFTPADSTKYGDFSFRGQLAQDGGIHVKVINQADNAFDFYFANIDSQQDFARIGIVSTDGDWFKSVEIWTDQDKSFKEIKQIDFSHQTEVPVPEPGTLLLLGVGLLGIGICGRRRMSGKG